MKKSEKIDLNFASLRSENYYQRTYTEMMLRHFVVTLLVSEAMGLPQTVPPPPFLPPASAGAGVAVGTTPLGGGVGVGAVSAFPSQPYIPDIGADIELVKEDGRFAVSGGWAFADYSGYFFNAMIIISLLLLVCNLLGISLLPAVTLLLENTGRLIREKIRVLSGKEGCALDVENLTRMAAFVDQAIKAYKKFQ